MERGDVFQVTLPPTSGREQSGPRPAVILQDSDYGQGSPLVLMVPFTSQVDAERFPGTVMIEPDHSNGLKKTSVALVFQIRGIDRKRFGKRLGALSEPDLEAILGSLDRLTGRGVKE